MERKNINTVLGALLVVPLLAQPPGKNLKTMNDMILEGGMRVTSSASKETIERQNNEVYPLMMQQTAIELWSNELEKNSESANLNYKLGLCYFFSSDLQHKALPFFKKSIRETTASYDFYNEKETRAPVSAYYFLAASFLENNLPDSAIKYYAMYDEYSGPLRLNTELGVYNSINAKLGSKNPRNVKVSDFGNVVNTPYSETNPVMRLDNKCLFFSSRRPGANTQAKTEKDADIYFTIMNQSGKWENVQVFPHNSPDDEAPVYISPNGDVLYFRRVRKNNSDIYKSEWKDNTWTKPTPVNELNSAFNETAISITGDGKELYLCSDQNKEAGKYDIFKFTKQKDGKWGNMQLLSKTVNNSYNQICPYISPDGKTLFYSSNSSSKQGFGGYDIFYSEQDADGNWKTPQTMGYPINKTRDDINYWVASNDKRYYASLTESSSYDIFLVEGGGFDFENIAAGTDVVTVTSEMGVTQVMETEKAVEKEVEVAQAVETVVEKEKEVEVIKTVEVEKEKEVPIASDADMKGDGSKIHLSDEELNLENLDDESRNTIIDLVKNYLTTELKNNSSVVYKVVHFDLNKQSLSMLSKTELKVLVDYMREHPDLKIEIVGHTDNTGSWSKNNELSMKRAGEVYSFLMAKNIPAKRMHFYGKGSSSPMVPNDTDDGKAKNRRVEVIIIK